LFCDESKADGFRLASVTVNSADLAALRAKIDALRLPGQRRVHFSSERDGRRKQIIRVLIESGVQSVIYDAATHRSEKAARDAVIGLLADDAAAMGADRLVLERDDSNVASDRRAIREHLVKAGRHDAVRYDHLRAHEECLLAVPDAIIWCWAKGGSWRKLISPLVTDVIVV
jgi:hypothetical protein